MKTGDVYRIAAGSAFYLVNTAEGQKLLIICSIDTSDSYGWQWHKQGFQVPISPFRLSFENKTLLSFAMRQFLLLYLQSFFVAGGTNPTSILAGFDPLTMSTAFNVSMNFT